MDRKLEQLDEELKDIFKCMVARSTAHASVMLYRMKAYRESLDQVDRKHPLPEKYKEMNKNIDELIHCFEVMLQAIE